MGTLFFERDWYFQNYSYLPAWLASARYGFSWLQRLVGITTAIGLLSMKEIFRKIAMGLGWFTIATVYWKHPYQGFQKTAEHLKESLAADSFLSPSAVNLPITSHESILMAVIIYCAMDVTFWLCVNFYLTRPAVKARFHP